MLSQFLFGKSYNSFSHVFNEINFSISSNSLGARVFSLASSFGSPIIITLHDLNFKETAVYIYTYVFNCNNFRVNFNRLATIYQGYFFMLIENSRYPLECGLIYRIFSTTGTPIGLQLLGKLISPLSRITFLNTVIIEYHCHPEWVKICTNPTFLNALEYALTKEKIQIEKAGYRYIPLASLDPLKVSILGVFSNFCYSAFQSISKYFSRVIDETTINDSADVADDPNISTELIVSYRYQTMQSKTYGTLFMLLFMPSVTDTAITYVVSWFNFFFQASNYTVNEVRIDLRLCLDWFFNNHSETHICVDNPSVKSQNVQEDSPDKSLSSEKNSKSNPIETELSVQKKHTPIRKNSWKPAPKADKDSSPPGKGKNIQKFKALLREFVSFLENKYRNKDIDIDFAF